MTHFDDLGLSGQALQAVAQLGYSTPTPVQEQAIPKVLEGRDLIAAAKTGTGKTAAFSLPTMDKLGHAKGNKGPLMLVVTPTRELAEQIGEVCGIIAKNTHHRILTVVGGVSYNPQIQALNRGVDVLIATPGRLVDLMDQGAAHLSSVEVLVLDEADRMLDMGFWPAMRKIIGATPQNRQTLLFSATIDRTIMSTAGKLLHDPAMVEIAHKGETADTVEQYVMHVQQAVKPELLKGLMKERGHRRVIVFCRTRSRADATCRRLKKVGYSVEAIHSSRSQNQRRRALENFANGTTDVLVATDVLARGIDVEEVEYVVNYDLPTQPRTTCTASAARAAQALPGSPSASSVPKLPTRCATSRSCSSAPSPSLSLRTSTCMKPKARPLPGPSAPRHVAIPRSSKLRRSRPPARAGRTRRARPRRPKR